MSRGRDVVILIVLVVAMLFVRAPSFVAPMGQDQGLYHTVGQGILHGQVPYRDAWDPKPPGVFYIHAAILALIPDPWRVCRIGSLPGLSRSDIQPRCGTLLFQAVDAAYTLWLGALVLWLARRFRLTDGAAIAAFGSTVLFGSLALLDAEGNTPEKYALGPAIGVVVAASAYLHCGQRRWLVVAGVAAAVAALFKPTHLASFGAVSMYVVLTGRSRALPWLWAPMLACLLSVWAVFAAAGAGAEFVEATLVYNVARFGFEAGSVPQAALDAVRQMFRDGLAALWLLAAVGAVFASRWRRYGRLLLLWASLDILALFLGGTKFTRVYFLQLVPSFSMLAALALQSAWVGRPWVVRGGLVAAAAALAVTTSGFQARYALRAWNDYVAFGWTTTSIERLASMAGALPADETIFVWGDEAQLYALSGRQPATRFLNLVGLAASGDPAVTARRAEVFATLEQDPPALIVVDRRTEEDDPDGRLLLNPDTVPELQQLLGARYREMDGAVLRGYPGGGREHVYVRIGQPDVCRMMDGCRLI